MTGSPEIIGRIGLHPRRLDRLCVLRGRHILASFGRDQDRAAVTAILCGQGYAVRSDLTVVATPIGQAGTQAG